MSGPVGHTFIYNLIIIFIVIVFGFLAGTMSYYKAFKINNRIVSSVEKFEGYNSYSVGEIKQILTTFGYSLDKINCPSTYKNMYLVLDSASQSVNPHKYCIYMDNLTPAKGTYYTYGILTYMNIDLPFVNKINIPVFTKSNRIYKFTNN